MINSAKNIQWQADPALGGNLIKGKSMEDAVLIIDKLLTMLFDGQDLSEIDLSEYGITCPPDGNKNILQLLLHTLLDSQLALGERLVQINNAMTNVNQVTNTISDERVKASKDSTEAKFLIDAIEGTAGKISYNKTTDKVKIIGLIPIGARMTLNQKRLSDMDANGYGKPGTDLEGWQIRNGNKGTDNALGRIIMYTDTLNNAGVKAGIKEILVDQLNIKSITFPIIGTIDEALSTPIEVEVPYGKVNKHFGAGADRDVCVPDLNIVTGYRKSKPVNLKHTHAVNLQATLSNPQPTPISIIPEHIKEVPIEFVG